MNIKTFLSLVLVAASTASAHDDPEEESNDPEKFYNMLWSDHPIQGHYGQSFFKLPFIMLKFMDTSEGTNDQRLLEARRLVDFVVNLSELKYDSYKEKCDTAFTTFDSINLAEFPPKLIDHIRQERRSRIEWCHNWAEDKTKYAINRLRQIDEDNLILLTTNIGLVNGSSIITTDAIARGIKIYLLDKKPFLATIGSPESGQVHMDFVTQYSREIASLCNTVTWTFRLVTPTVVSWLRQGDDRMASWKLWLKRRDVCQLIIDQRDVLIPASFAAIID